MARTDTEVKLLKVRQRYLDALEELLRQKVVDMRAYRYVTVKIKVSNVLLQEYRDFCEYQQRRNIL